MQGWIIPPPKEPTKTKEDFSKERKKKVKWLSRQGYLRSERIRDAVSKVPREHFIPFMYKDYAYSEVPLPLPGEEATISCPHSYPLFYKSLGLDIGHKFLEVGLGSGFGTAVAREIVGSEGLVVSIEIDPLTFEFARKNLENEGYNDIVLVKGEIDVLHATGAVDYVKEKANRKLREGQSYLDNTGLPEEGREFFDGLVNFLEQRKI